MADATGQNIIDEVAKQTTLVASLQVYNMTLRQRLADAMAANNGVLTQDQLNKVFTDLQADNQGIADAMVENTPNAP